MMKKITFKKRVLQATLLMFALLGSEKMMGQNSFPSSGDAFLSDNQSLWIGNVGDTKTRLRLHHATDGNAYIDYQSKLYIRTGTTTPLMRVMLFGSNGNVGINYLTENDGKGMYSDFNVKSKNTDRKSKYGVASFQGSLHKSSFYWGDDERTMIRGGRDGSPVVINDLVGLGNVGIGLGDGVVPQAKLDVARGTAQNGTAAFRATNSDYTSFFNYSTAENTYIRGGKASSNVLINDLDGLGNVGIGTTNPQAKLHVAGDVYIPNLSSFKIGDPSSGLGMQLTASDKDVYMRYGKNLIICNSNWQTGIRILDNGNIGVGTNDPISKLHVEGDVYIPYKHSFWIGANADAGARLRMYHNGTDAYVDYQQNCYFRGVSWNNITMTLTGDGKVGIGVDETKCTSNNYKLFVGGGILAELVEIRIKDSWPDFVFAKDYKLQPLHQVEQFIKENKHLPNVPSESQVKREGIDVAKMDATLLQKVEELTLYLIEQNKKLEAQSQKLEAQNQRIEQLEKENAKLKK